MNDYQDRLRRLLPSRHFYGRWRGNKVRRRWWSFLNWRAGLKWDAVGRFRCCDHTTPYHYRWCETRKSGANVCSTCGLFIRAGGEPRATGTGSYCLDYGDHEATDNESRRPVPVGPVNEERPQ